MSDEIKNPYRSFKTDENLERDGIYLDYGAFRVKVGRAGGTNKKYLKGLEAKLRPHRRAIQTETMSDEVADRLVLESFVDGVVIAWEVKVAEATETEPAKYEVGMHDVDTGEKVAVTKERMLATLKRLPDLFLDMREQATKATMFLQEVKENDGKNS